MRLRISDADASYENLDMGAVELSRGGLQQSGRASGWTYFEAPMPEEKYWLEPPFNVVAIYFIGRSLYRMPPGSIYLDDITVKLKPPDGGAGEEVIEDFEEIGRWVALPHDGRAGDSVVISSRAGRDEGRGMEFTWQDPLLQEPRGMLIPPGDFPLAAVGSPELANGQTLRLDMGTQLVPLIVQEPLSYFPTLSARNNNFVLISLKSFQDYTSRLPRGNQGPPREYWLKLEEGADRQEAVRLVREATSVSATSGTGPVWWSGTSETPCPVAAGTG